MNWFQPISTASVRRDVPAGVVVFLVALPLCLGIALGSGAPLFAGVIAGVIGGIVVALFSGSELSVSGPAAGLTVIVAGAIQKVGSFDAFLLAVVLSGLFQLLLAQIRAGILGNYIPNSVIKGMLAAIGVVIILKQLPHALGHDDDFLGDEAFRQVDQRNTMSELWDSVLSVSPGAVVISLVALSLLILWDKPVIKKRTWAVLLPAPLLCVVIGVVVNELFGAFLPAWKLTSADHLVQLPVAGGPSEWGRLLRFPDFNAITNRDVWIAAATIGLVGSIETLLCLEASEKLDPEKRLTNPNQELRAQGIGNLVSGLVGGIPMTSVIVRTSANVYAGGRTRLSSIVHGVLLLLCALLIPSLLNRVPLACLAAVLIAVGYKLASLDILRAMFRDGPSQYLPFVATLVGIVFTDLLIGIGIGLLVSVYFVIRSNLHAAVTVVHEGNDWLVRFNKDMSFIHKSELKERLRQIPDNTSVVVDGTKALYVDHDVYDTLREFEASAGFRRIQISFRNLAGKERGQLTASDTAH